MLVIVATPIGNLKDITQRALETLQTVDGIICEDSRRASILLNHYQIQKPLLVINDFNESKMIAPVMEKLKSGQNLALISDAGTPLISDPGFKLVRECFNQGISVDCFPGPSAVIAALTLSALPPDKFFFLGYLPGKVGHRQKTYQQIKSVSEIIPVTFILFIAPFKLVKTITEMKEFLGDVNATLAKELTKIHQRIEEKKLSEWLIEFEQRLPKGEYVMLIRLI